MKMVSAAAVLFSRLSYLASSAAYLSASELRASKLAPHEPPSPPPLVEIELPIALPIAALPIAALPSDASHEALAVPLPPEKVPPCKPEPQPKGLAPAPGATAELEHAAASGCAPAVDPADCSGREEPESAHEVPPPPLLPAPPLGCLPAALATP